MKKLLFVLMALALVSPAMAETQVSISGSYDVTAIASDNVTAQNIGVDDLDDADKHSYLHQRFRVGSQIKVADGVTGNLRFDFAEGIFGQDRDFDPNRAGDTTTANAAYPDADSPSDDRELQVDRAYVDVDTAWLRIRAGLQFVVAGQTQVFRDNQPALQFNIKTGTPFGIRLAWIKASESIGVATGLSDDADADEDTDRYLVDLSYHTDPIKINAFYVMQTDDGTGDTDGDTVVDNFKDEPNVAGLRVRTSVGGIAIKGEIATFSGDDGNGTDYVGTQANVNGMMKISDALSVGVDLFYSSAEGANEQKIIFMGNPLARYDVKYGGTMGWDMLTYGRNTAILFTSSPPGGPLDGDIFDPFNTGAGSMGAGIGAKFIPIEKVTLIGQLHYMVAEDDDITGVTGEFENGYNLLLAAVYQLAPKTSLHGTAHFVDADFADNVSPDSSYVYGLRMHVAF
jgi:hypothetical protein